MIIIIDRHVRGEKDYARCVIARETQAVRGENYELHTRNKK